MTKNHNDYWQKRVDDIFKHQDMTDEAFFKELSRIYSESSLSLQKDLFEFYGKYAEDSKISLPEARERLSRVDLSDYRANVEKYRKQAEKDPELLRRINEQYMSSRATRMDVLNMEVVYKMGVLQGILEKSFESYLRSSAEYAYRKAMGGRSGNINEPALKEIIKTPFNGYNYSQQLWGHVDNLAKDLKDTLKRGFVRGEHPKVLARDLSARYKVANHRAETLIRTDGTAVVNAAAVRRYMDAGLEYYRILVHMDNRTTQICRRIHAEDKRYRLDEMKVGLNAPPFHFNCRSGIVPDEEELGIDRSSQASLEDSKESDYKKFKRRQVFPKNEDGLISDERYSEFRNTYRQVTREKFQSGTPLGKQIFIKYADPSKVATLSEIGKVRYEGGKLYLNMFRDVDDSRGAGTGYFHEIGHQVDDRLGWKFTKDINLTHKLEKDFLNLNFESAITLINSDDKASSLSDVISGLSEGTIVGKYWHSADYWKDNANLRSEFFAHVFESQFDRERREILEKYLPESYNYVVEILKGD
ncbi:TPA: minor capsid protein [Streptococcus suis]